MIYSLVSAIQALNGRGDKAQLVEKQRVTNTCHTCTSGCSEQNGVYDFFVVVCVLFFNGFSVVATLLNFVVSINSPLAVSCYCNNFEYQGLSSIIVSL